MSLSEPPDGLDLTDTKVPSLVSGFVITWVLGAATVALRVTARKLVGNKIWWDDWIIIVSLVGFHPCPGQVAIVNMAKD